MPFNDDTEGRDRVIRPGRPLPPVVIPPSTPLPQPPPPVSSPTPTGGDRGRAGRRTGGGSPPVPTGDLVRNVGRPAKPIGDPPTDTIPETPPIKNPDPYFPAPVPDTPAEKANGRLLTFPNTGIAHLPVIYGPVRTGGIVAFWKRLSSGKLLVIYNICYGPINSISNIKVDDVSLANLFLTVPGTHYEIRLGSPTATLSPLLSLHAPEWESANPGVAQVIILFHRPDSVIPAPNVLKFQCDVEGLLVRDPRTDATLTNLYYRPNPALCLADGLTQKRFPGGQVTDSEMDWFGSVTQAANDCDEIMSNGRKRFLLGIMFRNDTSIEGFVEAVRSTAQIYVTSNDKYFINCDVEREVSEFVLTDVGDDANILSGSMRVKGAAECPNHVIGRFVNIEKDYQDDQVEYEYASLSSDFSMERVTHNLEIQGVPYSDQMGRIALWRLNLSTMDKEVTLELNHQGAFVLPGMVCPVTCEEIGFTDTLCICRDIQPNGTGFTYIGELYNPAIFSDEVQDKPVQFGPTNPTPYDTPLTPTDVIVAFGPMVSYPDTIGSATLYFDPPESAGAAFIERYNVYRVDTTGGAENPQFLTSIPANAVPTSTNPAVIADAALYEWIGTLGTGGVRKRLGVKVTSVTTAGIESPLSSNGHQVIEPIPQTTPSDTQHNVQATVTLVNGQNNDIGGQTNDYWVANYLRLTGPTGAFSISGIKGPVAGKRITLYNSTSQTATILAENVSSTASLRILTGHGTTIAAGKSTDYIYDSTAARWRLVQEPINVGVTSVALDMPTEFNVSGSPVTSTGTFTVSKASQTQKTFYAAPNSTSGAPIFRTIQHTDLPRNYATLDIDQWITGNWVIYQKVFYIDSLTDTTVSFINTATSRSKRFETTAATNVVGLSDSGITQSRRLRLEDAGLYTDGSYQSGDMQYGVDGFAFRDSGAWKYLKDFANKDLQTPTTLVLPDSGTAQVRSVRVVFESPYWKLQIYVSGNWYTFATVNPSA